MRSLHLPLIAIALLLLALVSIARTRPVREPAEPVAPPPVSPFEHAIGAVGMIEANTENVEIGTPIAGVVSEVLVRAGDDVRAGDPLFRVDSRKERADLAVHRAALAAAEANSAARRAELEDLRDQARKTERLVARDAASRDALDRLRFGVRVAEAALTKAQAEIRTARAQVDATEVEIERRTVRAAISGRVLRLEVRVGEFAAAGALETPLLLLGNVTPLHVRVDVDEENAARVFSGARAVALERGNSTHAIPLEFVRFEPYVLPKRSLSGDPTERVDTRVLQAIFRVAPGTPRLFVGQQVDVFVEASVDAPGGESSPRP
jgi:RND family efflux transporter MFP subunit